MDNLETPVIVKSEESSRLGKISFGLMLVLVFLLPIFFVPGGVISFQFAKMSVFALITLVSFSILVIEKLRRGEVKLPFHPLFFSLIAILCMYFVSTLLSPLFSVSLFGSGFEIDTLLSLFVFFLSLFTASTVFRSDRSVFYFYLAFLLSFLVIALFHILRLVFGPEFLAFGIFKETTTNLIGKWNDLGIFAGLASLLSYLTLDSIELSKAMKRILVIVFALSLFILVLVNFPLLWLIVGLFGFVFILHYFFSIRKAKKEQALDANGSVVTYSKKIPLLPVLLLLSALIFGFGNTQVANFLTSKFAVSQIEVRPSFPGTYQIIKGALSQNLFFGAGPNRFLGEWTRLRPQSINVTPYWNVDFNYGVGLIPSLAVTTGLVGLLSWIVFFVFFVREGVRSIFTKKSSDPFTSYLAGSSFFAALYLWIFSVLYIPSTVTFGLTFLFTGVFLGVLIHKDILKQKTFSFAKNPRTGFVFAALLIVLLIGLVVTALAFGEKVLGAVRFQSGVNIFNSSGKLDQAGAQIVKAVGLSDDDFYYRTLVQIDLLKIKGMLAEAKPTEELKVRFQNSVLEAVAHAERAVKINNLDYRNFLSLGAVYEALVPLKLAGAYDNASAFYVRAQALNPQNPFAFFLLARLEAESKNYDKSREYIKKALELKPDYTDAIFLLSQIEVLDGNTQKAITALRAAVQASRLDPGLLFELGLLEYNAKNYNAAGEAFSLAVEKIPTYANAKYFLGLTLDKVGRTKDAIAVFTDLAKTNPDNEEIARILRNLKTGGSASEVSDTPVKAESRKTLPIKEGK